MGTGALVPTCLPPARTAGPILSTEYAAALSSRLVSEHSLDVCSEYAKDAESHVNAAADTSEGMETELSTKTFTLTHPV